MRVATSAAGKLCQSVWLFFFFLLGFLSGAFCGNSPNYFADIVLVVAGESLICFYFSLERKCGGVGGVCAGWFFLFGHLLLALPFNEINYERGEQQLVAMKMKCHLLAAWMAATICHRAHHNSTGMSLSMGPGTSCCSSGAFRFPFDWNFNKRTMTEVWDWFLLPLLLLPLPGNCHSKFMQPTQASGSYILLQG